MYHGKYQARLAQIAAHTGKFSGLHLCGNYAGGVAIRERIYQGGVLADHIAQNLNSATRNRHFYSHTEPFEVKPA